MPTKLMKIKSEDLINHAKENGNVKFLKEITAEVASKESNPMRQFAQIRKAYVAKYLPELLEKKKTKKKGASLIDRIMSIEE